jgi:hypothetical protein
MRQISLLFDILTSREIVKLNSDKFFLLLAAFVLISGCSQTLWISRDFDSIKTGIDTIPIILPHISYYEKSGEVNKLLLGRTLFVSSNVAEILKETIDEGIFISKSTIILNDSMVTSQWLPRYFLSSIKKYAKIDDSIQASDNGGKTFPITPELKLLVDQVNTRYFIFINGTAFGTQEDSKQYDIQQAQTFELFYDSNFSYEYQWYGLQLHIYLVEKESNEIIWDNYNKSRDTNYDPLNNNDIKELCLKLFQ